MTAGLWIVLACGFLVVVVRRPSAGAALLVAQSATLAVMAALEARHEPELVSASVVLALKTAALIAGFAIVVRQSHDRRPVHPRLRPSARALVAIAAAGALVLLVPPMHLADPLEERTVVALLGIGMATTLVRRSTLLQIVGVVIAENAVALAALSAASPVPFVIELGVALDVIFVVFVAAALHHRIQRELGAGDSDLLRTLRD